MKTIFIGGKKIGLGQPTFIIAEAGVNHNGDVKLAERLIIAAAKTGADAIKFQTFKAEQVTTKFSPTAAYQKKNVGEDNQWKLLRPLELNEATYPRLIQIAKANKIMFLSTPHGHIDSAKFLKPLVPAWKTGSGDLTNLPFLKWLGETGKPIILATGMATIPEIKEAVDTIAKTGNRKVIILHCTTNYPCPDNEANVTAMLDIKKHFPKYEVGFSDHTLGIDADLLAAGLGAVMIEKHFTLDRKMPGPDQQNSLEPKELKEMVDRIRRMEILKGTGKKKPFKSELIIAEMARKAVIALTDIKKGEKFTAENLTIKRPAKGGLHPKFYWKIIGKVATKNIQADVQVHADDWQNI